MHMTVGDGINFLLYKKQIKIRLLCILHVCYFCDKHNQRYVHKFDALPKTCNVPESLIFVYTFNSENSKRACNCINIRANIFSSLKGQILLFILLLCFYVGTSKWANKLNYVVKWNLFLPLKKLYLFVYQLFWILSLSYSNYGQIKNHNLMNVWMILCKILPPNLATAIN